MFQVFSPCDFLETLPGILEQSCLWLGGAAPNKSHPFPQGNNEVREQLSYWTPFPKKLGGEKHYSVAELGEEFAMETNHFGLGRRGGKQFDLCPSCSFPAEKKVRQTPALCPKS